MAGSKRILMVAMPSLHFFRWVDQLKDSGFEVFWFDITGAGKFIERISWVHQITDWKLRWDYPGRFFIKRNFPGINKKFQIVNERNPAAVFEKKLKEIKPDLVHSFALYVSCTPIISVMEKYPNLKWLYSSWGSDLFYFKNDESHLKDIKKVLPRVTYLFTDCKRDYVIAKKLGFRGEFLGVFPGGGGFDFELMEKFNSPFEKRNIILIKGYQGRSGRAIQVLKALCGLKEILSSFGIVVFGADKETMEYVGNSQLSTWKNMMLKGKIPHEEVLELMGKSKIYIGNSNSDGIPNTLLEAICMDVFPIQSNPGGVTEEVIKDGVNGILIRDCEDKEEISLAIKAGLILSNKLERLSDDNAGLKSILDRNVVKNKIVSKYRAALKNSENRPYKP